MPPINKILFAYPVIYKEGMTKEENCIPAPLISNVKIGESKTLVVTLGLMIEFDESIMIRAFIHPAGKFDRLEPVNDNGKFIHLKKEILPHNRQAILLSSLYIEDVLIENSGIYEIKILLIRNGTDAPENDETIDELTSSFYILTREGV